MQSGRQRAFAWPCASAARPDQPDGLPFLAHAHSGEGARDRIDVLRPVHTPRLAISPRTAVTRLGRVRYGARR
jgi:hypothetical protein